MSDWAWREYGEARRKEKLLDDEVRRVHTPCFTIDRKLHSKVKAYAKKENQTPSRVVQAAIRWYISVLKYENRSIDKIAKTIYKNNNIKESVEITSEESRYVQPALFEVDVI